jgi:hypothetical protein
MSEFNKSSSVSRRTVLMAAAGAAPLLALMSGGAEAKMAQSAVKYQDSPKDGKQCDGCNLFVAPNSCKTVAGDISPSGWCALWVKKAG